MAYSTLGYPYFMFFVDMEKVDRELSLNTEIRKVLKRSKRPLKETNNITIFDLYNYKDTFI